MTEATAAGDHWFLKDCVGFVISLVTAYITAKWVSKIGRQEGRLGDVVAVIEDIMVKGCSYWRSEGIDAVREVELAELFDRLWNKTDTFFDYSADQAPQNAIDRATRVLHEATTGGSFATVGRLPSKTVEKRVRLLSQDLRHKAIGLSTRVRVFPRVRRQS